MNWKPPTFLPELKNLQEKLRLFPEYPEGLKEQMYGRIQSKSKSYPEIKLEKKRGEVYYVAFCYLPEGIKVLKGSYSTIGDYVKKNYSVCHAMLTAFVNKEKGQTLFEILGDKKEEYELLRISKLYIKRKSFIRPWLPEIIKDLPDNHKRFVLLKKEPQNLVSTITGEAQRYKILGTWRKLPKCYLKQFQITKETEPSKIMDRYECLTQEKD